MREPGLFTAKESVSIRDSYKALDNCTFLNTAGMAPLPAESCEAMSSLLDDLNRSAYLNMKLWGEKITTARRLSAEIVGASEREIAFVRNTSEGVSIVASGMRWSEGDEIIISDLEFPSNVYPWLNLRRLGVEVRTIKSEGGRVTVDSIRAAVTRRTRLVAISSVQYLSGYMADLSSLGQMARERGFRLFVDAIQSLGVIPMDAKGCGVDFLSSGGFKWLCGPLGTGIFFCDVNRLDELDLTRVGWNTVQDSFDYSTIDYTIRDDAQRFEEGSPNLVGICGLLESLKLVMSAGVDRNRAHVIGLTDMLVDGLLGKGCKILSPRGDGEKSGIVNFAPREPDGVERLMERFGKEGIIVMKRGSGIRVSPHYYNTPEDIDRLLETI